MNAEKSALSFKSNGKKEIDAILEQALNMNY
jgi:hypothetical protein